MKRIQYLSEVGIHFVHSEMLYVYYTTVFSTLLPLSKIGQPFRRDALLHVNLEVTTDSDEKCYFWNIVLRKTCIYFWYPVAGV